MFKKILFFWVLFLSLPVFAGIYEDALSKNDKVFLYLYTPDCKTCKSFDTTYNNLSKDFKDFKFVRVNANTYYGYNLMEKFNGLYVPYIILTNAKEKKSVNVHHSCIMDNVCLIRALKSFKS